MVVEEHLEKVHSELEAGMALPKCRQCGCMAGALDNLAAAMPFVGTDNALALAGNIPVWREQMRPVQYSCLGCKYCFPAVAQNEFSAAFPTSELTADLSCDFGPNDRVWPPVAGEYFVLDQNAPVAVSTLASAHLAQELAQRGPAGLAIVGKTETENIGIDKVIKNVTSNPSLRYLILAGAESEGHLVGQTMLALATNGVDGKGRVLGSSGKRPVLRNVSALEIETFRGQVQVIDMIGQEELQPLRARIAELSGRIVPLFGRSDRGPVAPLSISTAPAIQATEPGEEVILDKAGYFVIVPLPHKGLINVEHYAYDNQLLRIIEGSSSREIYHTIIQHGWVTELSHAAYLGKELAKAELSLQFGFKYLQDGA